MQFDSDVCLVLQKIWTQDTLAIVSIMVLANGKECVTVVLGVLVK